MNEKELAVKQLKMDGGTQPRAQIDFSLVDEYAEAMKAGAKFPPVVVFYDGTTHWLADGFHRAKSAERNGGKVLADVRQGTRRDAILYSVGANALHGQRRSSDDKRRAVMTLLTDKEWSQWPHEQIADSCCVSRWLVVQVAKELPSSCKRTQDAARSVSRGGTTYAQDTRKIGGRRPPGPAEIAADAHMPIRGHSRPAPMVALDLPKDNPKAAAAALLSFFDADYLRKLIKELERQL